MKEELAKIVSTSNYLERLIKRYMRTLPVEEKWICEEAIYHLAMIQENYEELEKLEIQNKASSTQPSKNTYLHFHTQTNFRC